MDLVVVVGFVVVVVGFVVVVVGFVVVVVVLVVVVVALVVVVVEEEVGGFLPIKLESKLHIAIHIVTQYSVFSCLHGDAHILKIPSLSSHQFLNSLILDASAFSHS
ncbi:MAG: hypothetical protein PHO23_01810 [Candidatus Pacebacteria bacterium]|nr:hypothetical protein [Candidatus Paceibacterota bacterium]